MNAAPNVVVIGAGPAGLMAADALAARGLAVDVFDAMPSAGRKFLMAGRGGLNLTHSEAVDRFLSHYGAAEDWLGPMISAFGPEAVRRFAADLGIETFAGSSGRVFPVEMKAAPLLRAWLRRLGGLGARLHLRHRWTGWDEAGQVLFTTPEGTRRIPARATVLALGGGSWRRLGSDGAWSNLLAARGVPVRPFAPANCGFDIPWSPFFRERFAGAPLKSVALSFAGVRRQGECVVTAHGIEGGVVYSLSAALRDAIAADGSALLQFDLAPGRDEAALAAALARPRGRRSIATHLRRVAGLEGAKAALLREGAGAALPEGAAALARLIKACPLRLVATRPIDEAISTAGGVPRAALDDGLMLRALPGVFCAGEMLDWEAPTGGYLLTACLATGLHAGRAAADWLARA